MKRSRSWLCKHTSKSNSGKIFAEILRVGERVFIPARRPEKNTAGAKIGKWLKVEIIAVKGTMAVISTGVSFFRVNVCKLGRLLDTVDLEEPPDSRERTGARVLWLSCEGQLLQGFWSRLKEENPRSLSCLRWLPPKTLSKRKSCYNNTICVRPWQNIKYSAEHIS